MIDLLLIIIAGLGVGILTGLLPALPVYTGPFLLYQFHHGMSLEQLLVFWMTVYVGSQFFGSIATITTKIPGEESSLIYINDLDKYTLAEKNLLLFDTALGSYIAAVIATVLLWIIASYASIANLSFLYSIKTQALIYGTIIISFIFINKKVWYWSLLTILFGLSIAPHNNYALPPAWYSFQEIFEGYTFYLIILGTMIIPTVFDYSVKLGEVDKVYQAKHGRKFDWFASIKSSMLGFFAGLIPGPSASVGAIAAYKLVGKSTDGKIIAAETANNSAVIASTIPFLILALPINQNSIIMSGIMDLQGIDVLESLFESSTVFESLSVIDVSVLAVLLSVTIYYLLSTTLINFYVKLIVILHERIKIVLVLILSGLIALDIQNAEITIPHYFVLLGFFTLLGYAMKRLKVSPLPMMFTILLGDKLVWSGVQLIKLYS